MLGEVTFKPGSDFLTARARGDLDRVAKLLLSFPEVPVEIQAHTDNEGPSDANLVLSMKRAEAVVTYLVSQEVNELQMQARGIGENRPISSNATTPAGRQRNRRVEMVTLPNLTLAAMSGEAQGPDASGRHTPGRGSAGRCPPHGHRRQAIRRHALLRCVPVTKPNAGRHLASRRCRARSGSMA